MVRVAQGSEGDGRDGRDDGRVGRSRTKGSEPARTGRRRDGLNGARGGALPGVFLILLIVWTVVGFASLLLYSKHER
jgi:hypothetical protein